MRIFNRIPRIVGRISEKNHAYITTGIAGKILDVMLEEFLGKCLEESESTGKLPEESLKNPIRNHRTNSNSSGHF